MDWPQKGVYCKGSFQSCRLVAPPKRYLIRFLIPSSNKEVIFVCHTQLLIEYTTDTITELDTRHKLKVVKNYSKTTRNLVMSLQQLSVMKRPALGVLLVAPIYKTSFRLNS